jgi:hypothetical protein
MLKNKDGSYNKFPLLIICLIALISVIIIGMVMIENVDFPKIYAAPPTPAITPVETYIQKNISYPLVYNATLGVSNTTYTYGDEYKNWTSINNTNTTYFVVAGGGGGVSHNISGITPIPSPEVTSPAISPVNQTVSSLILSLSNPFDSSNWFLLTCILCFPLLLILFKSRQALAAILLLIIIASFFNFIHITTFLLITGMILVTYILMIRLFDR